MNSGQVIDPEWAQAGAKGRSVRYAPPGFSMASMALATLVRAQSLPAPAPEVEPLTHVIKDDPDPLLLRAQPIAEHVRKVMAGIVDPATIVEIADHAKLKPRQVAAYIWRAGDEVQGSGLTAQRRYTLTDLGRRMVAEVEARDAIEQKRPG